MGSFDCGFCSCWRESQVGLQPVLRICSCPCHYIDSGNTHQERIYWSAVKYYGWYGEKLEADDIEANAKEYGDS